MAAKRKAKGPPKCTKCNGHDHVAKDCRVTWRKAWPGRWVMRLGLRTPNGTAMELTIPLGDALSKQALTLWDDSVKSKESEEVAREFKDWPEPTKKDNVK